MEKLIENDERSISSDMIFQIPRVFKGIDIYLASSQNIDGACLKCL